MEYLKQVLGGIVGGILVLLGSALLAPAHALFGAAAVPNLTTVSNPFLFSNTQSRGGVTIASSTITAGQVLGTMTFKGPVYTSYTNSTSSTATSQTLIASDIVGFSNVLFMANTDSTTLTFPATSTLASTFIPNAGDMQDQCWYNATSTASKNITFVAGSGFDFEVASSTAKAVQGNLSSNLLVVSGNSGCFHFIRKANTDIVGQFRSFTDAD